MSTSKQGEQKPLNATENPSTNYGTASDAGSINRTRERVGSDTEVKTG